MVGLLGEEPIMKPGLFQSGRFTLASGHTTDFKIECDALTDDDWQTIGHLLRTRLRPFGDVVGVPRGGLKLAEVMKQYITPGEPKLLIVDDVYTTGGSIRKFCADYYPIPMIGAVVFARRRPDHWITPLFSMDCGYFYDDF